VVGEADRPVARVAVVALARVAVRRAAGAAGAAGAARLAGVGVVGGVRRAAGRGWRRPWVRTRRSDVRAVTARPR
jgi:hypothetical protein